METPNKQHGFAENLTAKYARIFLIRLGPDALQYGDPWQFIVTCASTAEAPATAIFIGYAGPVTRELVRVAVCIAKRLGYSQVVWERARPGGMHLVTT